MARKTTALIQFCWEMKEYSEVRCIEMYVIDVYEMYFYMYRAFSGNKSAQFDKFVQFFNNLLRKGLFQFS